MTNFKKKLILLLLVLALTAGLIGIFFFYLPYHRAESAMSSGELLLTTLPDGSLRLSWPEAETADYYRITVTLPTRSEKEAPILAYQAFEKTGCSHVLPHLPADEDLTIRVDTVVEYTSAGKIHQRLGETDLEAVTGLRIPQVEALTCRPEPEGQKVVLDYTLGKGDRCRIYAAAPDGSETLLAATDRNHMEFIFGETDGLTVPEGEAQYTFRLEAFREAPGLLFEGRQTERFSVCREDLLDRDLNLALTANGGNIVTLSWQETKGQYYEVQQMDLMTGTWKVLQQVGREGPYTYTTRHLPSCHDYLFRVVAVGGQVMENSDIAALSQEIAFSSAPSTTYCTIWPMKDMPAYADAAMTQETDKVKAAAAYCVLEEVPGAFAIRLNGKTCYIDSNYCMINIPEFLGPLCAYNITNSYSSIYLVHEYEIPNVTGVVTPGYERVRMENGEYLVPLLYPTARKLETAAQNARAQGYRLKIYDSYRPYLATRDIYDRTKKILADNLPKQSYTGKITIAQEMTYEKLMTDGRWGLGSFLAAGGSYHNLGIALDLTLEDWGTGAELPMQSSIHDLSWYSVLSRNNDNANLLAQIMTGAGLGDLVSEWWHFQDNEAKDTLQLPTLYGGVTPECWMNDGVGWKYRRAGGSYFANCDREIGGVTYTFDENGYVDNYEEG